VVAALDRVLKGLLALLLGVLTVTVFLQVIVRFVLKFPLPWTEEVARLAFVYSIFVGATLAVRDRSHISVDFVLSVLPAPAQRAVKLVGSVLVAVFLVAMTWQGVEFVRITGVQVTPVMQVPFRYLYIVIPASGALMLLYLALATIDDLRGERAPGAGGGAAGAEGAE
jgi:TRAP-type C4-dicarboxylate transport system permease small subunit